MVNNKTNRYKDLITSEKKPELFNKIPTKEISYEDLEQVSQQHAWEIIRITKNLSETTRKIKNLEINLGKQAAELEKNHKEQKIVGDKLVFSQWQSYFSQQEFFALKKWFWVFISAAAFIILWWIFGQSLFLWKFLHFIFFVYWGYSRFQFFQLTLIHLISFFLW